MMQFAIRSVLAVLVLSLVCPALGSDAASRSVLSFDVDSAKSRPVNKVIELLKSMLATLEKEASADQEIYDKLGCWCETNEKEKTKSIADAEARITEFTNKVGSLAAQSASLTSEIEVLKKEIEASTDALNKATEIREKQAAEFAKEEKDLMESISALTSAVAVLGKHHSFLQMPHEHVLGIAASVQHELQKNAKLLKGVLTQKERREISSFTQQPDQFFKAPSHIQVKSNQEYNPQSSQIFGILQGMKESFETNLANAQKEEMANQKAFAELKAAKEKSISASVTQVEIKTTLLATVNLKIAEKKVDLGDTEVNLAADQKFLVMLKEKCAITDSEWEERQKTRSAEMKAVSEAISVLTSDDAHDTFTKTFSFTQIRSSTSALRRTQAANLLKDVSQRVHNPRLAVLANSVELDAFVKVKKAIDEMVAELGRQNKEDSKKKDMCIAQISENEEVIAEKEHEKAGLVAKIDDLTITVSELAKAIKTLTDEIAEMKIQVKRAGEDREKENMEFQATLADQRATQKLLKQALTVLQGFYAKSSLIQKQKQAQPAGFKAYETSTGAGSVMQLIQKIIADAASMETETMADEANAQKTYEAIVKETNLSIEKKMKDIVSKSEMKAKAENSKVDAEDAKDAVMTALEQASSTKAELHQSCDFLLKNFDIRQEARSEEIEALKQAKAILSGATFKEFLQAA